MIYAVPVVYGLGTVNADGYPNPEYTKQGSPILVDQDAIGSHRQLKGTASPLLNAPEVLA